MMKMYVNFYHLKACSPTVKQKATDLIRVGAAVSWGCLHRIDEYSTELSDTYENLRDRIFSIQEEVESGDLDAVLAESF